MYVDGHCHLYSFPDNEVENILKEIDVVIIAISEDLDSSKRTISLAERFRNRIRPCIGIHPWNVKGEESLNLVEDVLKLGYRSTCIGEVGLDGRFNRENLGWQREVFYKFVEYAKSAKKPLNIHALDAWEEVLDIVSSMGVKKAIFHWYSGPINLLERIRDNGYYITINPSVEFQRKHNSVLRRAPIDTIITESDGPYNYKGRTLHPRMIPALVNYIAEIKNVSREELIEIIYRNFKSYINQ